MSTINKEADIETITYQTHTTTLQINKHLFIDSKDLQKTICSICFEMFKNPTLLNNGTRTRELCAHTFCLLCITRSLQSLQQCPLCKQSTTIDQLLPNPQMRRDINELELKCYYYKEGCTWKGSIDSFTKHTNECLYNCEECKDCKQLISRNKINNHRDLCDQVQVSCIIDSRCTEKIKRCLMDEHVDRCLYHSIPCYFSSVGCTRMVCRMDESKHLKDDMDKHLAFTLSRNCDLENEIKNMRKVVNKNGQVGEIKINSGRNSAQGENNGIKITGNGVSNSEVKEDNKKSNLMDNKRDNTKNNKEITGTNKRIINTIYDGYNKNFNRAQWIVNGNNFVDCVIKIESPEIFMAGYSWRFIIENKKYGLICLNDSVRCTITVSAFDISDDIIFSPLLFSEENKSRPTPPSVMPLTQASSNQRSTTLSPNQRSTTLSIPQSSPPTNQTLTLKSNTQTLTLKSNTQTLTPLPQLLPIPQIAISSHLKPLFYGRWTDDEFKCTIPKFTSNVVNNKLFLLAHSSSRIAFNFIVEECNGEKDLWDVAVMKKVCYVYR